MPGRAGSHSILCEWPATGRETSSSCKGLDSDLAVCVHPGLSRERGGS